MIPLRSAPRATFLSAREAAARLGVKEATLYAYVARGLLRSEAADRGRARRYSTRDVDALLERKKDRKSPEGAARRALFSGAPVVESSISFVDGARLYYRGVDAVRLSERATFEQVTGLLLTGAIPDAQTWPHVPFSPPSELAALVRRIGKEALSFSVLQIVVPVLASLDEARFQTSPELVFATAKRLIPRMAFGLSLSRGVSAAKAAKAATSVAAALLIALGAKPTKESVHFVDRALILSAEHELNPSAFAARVAASSGADPYAVVSCALGALSGPKHGGACERVEALVREADTPAKAHRALVLRAARGEEIPGFGHPLYPNGDPRVPPLLALCKAHRAKGSGRADRSVRLDTLLAVVDVMAAEGSPAPTLDLALVAVAAALRLHPGSASALFAVGRTAGWLAHALEQYGMDGIIRPRARYTGPMPEGA